MQAEIRKHVAVRFLREVRTFINELIEGTNNYRQLYSLSEQFPHDYHDRFLVELIQNANDASTGGEVRIVLDENDQHALSKLYVANQGTPFTLKNFEALCSLGLSDKDPEESIGNKGLGFRSVLQVCKSPRIYSTAIDHLEKSKIDFSGYCFELNPSVREVIIDVIQEILTNPENTDKTSTVIRNIFDIDSPILCEASRINRLRSRLTDDEYDIGKEVHYLSPYSFPLPIRDLPAKVLNLGDEGFVTVVELILENEEDLAAARRAISEIALEYLLFLPKLNKLTVQHNRASDNADDLSRVLEKKLIGEKDPLRPPEPLSGQRIFYSLPGHGNTDAMSTEANAYSNKEKGDLPSRLWWLHSGDVTGELLRQALLELPENWHKINRAPVTVAIERTEEEPPSGYFSIYLPTLQQTGCPIWVNAPFLGNLARTEILTKKTYNKLLLGKAVDLILDMVNLLRDRGTIEDGISLIDIFDRRDDLSILYQSLEDRLEELGAPLKTLPVIYLEQPDGDIKLPLSAASICDIRLLPEFEEPHELLTHRNLADIGISIPSLVILERRFNSLKGLAERTNSNITVEAVQAANWIESLAHSISKSNASITDWNKFYEEVADLDDELYFKDELRTCKFLITDDNRVVSAEGKGPKIFAFPVRTTHLTEEDEEIEVIEDSKTTLDPRAKIPKRIKPQVAFLHNGIVLRQEGPGRPFNTIGRFLRTGSPPLVRDFETRPIVNDVIIPFIERIVSRPHQSSDDGFAQALLWAFQLYRARTEDSHSGVHWDRLYLPTVSGWSPASKTYFSRTWDTTYGHLIENAFPTNHPVLNSLLVSSDKFFSHLYSKGDVPTESEKLEWTSFLRDQVGVAQTPRVGETCARRNKPLDQLKHLEFTGSSGTYYTSELGNYYQLPDLLWEEYINYLKQELHPPIQGYEWYYLERQAMLDGFLTIDKSTAIPYAQLVAEGFSGIKDSLYTRVLRFDTGGYQPSGEADSCLGFALKQHDWIPYTTNQDTIVEGLTKAEKVWYVPPDILDAPGPKRYSIIKHLPKEVARSVTEDFRLFLGIRSVKVSSVNEGIALLGDLASIWKEDIGTERHGVFLDFWRDTLVETARLWNADLTQDIDSLKRIGLERGFNGLVVVKAGQRFPEWRNLVDEEDSDTAMVYLPDDVDLRSSLSDWVDMVEMRNEHIPAQANLLQAFFEQKLARISDLDLIPESQNVLNIEGQILSAPLLKTQMPWLEAFSLAVYALGRNQEMNLNRDDFRRTAKNMRRLKLVHVPGLQLRIQGIDSSKPPLESTCHYWDKYKSILVDSTRATNVEDLVSGLKAFFGVQDIESPLRLALSKLDHRLDDKDPPDLDEQEKALRFLHIDPSQYTRVRRMLATGDNEWAFERIIPAICALYTIDDGDKAIKIRDQLQELMSNSSIPEALTQIESLSMNPEDANKLYQLAADADSDDDMAYRMWTSFQLSLESWNRAIRTLGYPYKICTNDDIENAFSVSCQELRSIVIAIIRQALASSKTVEKYTGIKNEYDRIGLDPEMRRKYWELSYAIVINSVRTWIMDYVSGYDSKLIEKILHDDAENNQQIVFNAHQAGLDLEHNDELIEQNNRSQIQVLTDSVLTHLLAYWLANGHEKSPVPTAVSEARSLEKRMSSEDIQSMCQFSKIPETQCMQIVLGHLAESNVFNGLGIDHKHWDSLSSLQSDLTVAKEYQDRAQELLYTIKEHNEKRARTRTVLGSEYEIPGGDKFEGLGDLIESQLSSDFGDNVNIIEKTLLDEAPPRSSHRSGGGTRGRGKPFPTKDRELVGAVGEYIIYKILCKQIGLSEAARAWKSTNRRHFGFIELGDDSLGYDFEFTRENLIWQIEAKASRSEPDLIDMGDSEVNAATLATKRRSRTKYLICLVTNALTEPEVFTLGNPYHPLESTKFRVELGAARIYFKLPKQSSNFESDIDEIEDSAISP